MSVNLSLTMLLTIFWEFDFSKSGRMSTPALKSTFTTLGSDFSLKHRYSLKMLN